MKIAGIDPSINSTGICVFELDESLDVINGYARGFIQVKKNIKPYLRYFKKDNFKHNIEQNIWMIDYILEVVKDCSFIAIEDYSFNSTGRSVFQIGEYVGTLKTELLKAGHKIRLHEPTVIKMFASGKGNCDKITMCDVYDAEENKLVDLTDLQNYKQPKEDLVDSYYITKLLLLELKLRYGLLQTQNLDETSIKIFNRVTTANPENILVRDFLEV